jgi:hypothetical protein
MNIAQNCQNLAVGGYNAAELCFSAEAATQPFSAALRACRTVVRYSCLVAEVQNSIARSWTGECSGASAFEQPFQPVLMPVSW